MIVYLIPVKCYSCSKPYNALSYIRYADLYDDVTFPIESWMMSEVYAKIHPDSPYLDKEEVRRSLSFPIHVLGYNDKLDQEMLSSSKIHGVKRLWSKERHKHIPMNICPYCGAPEGGYYLLEEITDHYLYPDKSPDVFCEI